MNPGAVIGKSDLINGRSKFFFKAEYGICIGRRSLKRPKNQIFPIQMKRRAASIVSDVSRLNQFFDPTAPIHRPASRTGPWLGALRRRRWPIGQIAIRFALCRGIKSLYDKSVSVSPFIEKTAESEFGEGYQCALTLIPEQILWFKRENLEHKKDCLLIIQPSGSIPPSVRSNRSRQPGEVRETH